MRRWLLLALWAVLVVFQASAQTPIANRVRARALRLAGDDKMVARYTDDRRHCLYYIHAHRLYRYDALEGISHEVNFAGGGYDKILNSWLSQDGNLVFVLIDKGQASSFKLLDGQEVWRINSFTKKSEKIGSGVRVVFARKGYFYITRYAGIADTNKYHPRYYVEDFWFYDDGKPLWRKDRRLWK